MTSSLLIGYVSIVVGSGLSPAWADYDLLQEEYLEVNDENRYRPDTWLKGGLFSEIHEDTFTEITIDYPRTLKFEWGTNIPEADEGLWRLLYADLVRAGQEQTYTELATGIAGDAPTSVFPLDLIPYLPAKPPATPAVYIVQVIARKQPINGELTTIDSLCFPTCKTLGSWSNVVVINYSTLPPSETKFVERYHKATLVLDKISLIDDQSGGGDEEYFVAGFIQEMFENCDDADENNCRYTSPGKQFSFAPDLNSIDLAETCDEIVVRPYFRCLEPPTEEKPSESEFGLSYYYYERNRWSFRLGGEGDRWPRQYTVGLSLMEQDNGDLMPGWLGVLDLVEKKLATGDLLLQDGKLTVADLQELINEFGVDMDVLNIATNVAHATADAIAAAVGGSAGAVIGGVGAVVTAAIIVGAHIHAESKDDYYGTQLVSLAIESNRVDVIQQLPGGVTRNGQDEVYVVDNETRRFYGPPLANAAASFDGIVDITFHWEFSEMGL
jgi:hypothetical protein